MSQRIFTYLLYAAGAGAALLAVYLFVVSMLSCATAKLTTTVGWRHLRSRSISWVAIALVAVIVVLYLLIISVMEGIKEFYMDKLQSIQAHSTVTVGEYAWGIQRPKAWSQEMEKLDPGIRGVTVGLEVPAMAIFDHARTVGTIRGIDLDRELRVGRLKEVLKPDDLQEFGWHEQGGIKIPGCVIGGYWRKSYDLKVGHRVTFLFSDEEGEPRSMAFAIIGFFEGKNSSPWLEQAAYVDRNILAEKLGVPGTAKTLLLWLHDPNRPDLDALRGRVHAKMKELITRDEPDFAENVKVINVETWKEKDNKFYEGITRDNLMMRFIMSIFLAMVAFVIFLIFGRLVAEKVRDIGALRAIGATPFGIQSCFLVQGLLVGLIGLIVGLTLSYFVIQHVNAMALACGVDPFPTESFGADKIPTHTLPYDVLLISVLTLASALIGAFYPAWRASRLNPVECLRHE